MKKQIAVLGFALCSLLLAPCSPAEAQQAGKVARIGYLDPGSRSVNDANLEALQKGLRELGWVEKKNIAFEYRFGDNKGLAYDLELARELVRLNVDLIFAANASVLRAMEASTKIPIVMIHPIPVRRESFKALPSPAVTSPDSPTFQLN